MFIKTISLKNTITYVASTTITDHYSKILNISNTSNNRKNEPNPKTIFKLNQNYSLKICQNQIG